MRYSSLQSIHILLVEDNAAEANLFKEILNEKNMYSSLHTVHDGVEALDFLYKKGKYENAEKPDIIILDLNLPKKDGREVLAEIKTDEKLKVIPVIIMTTSKAPTDIETSYRLQANSYIPKPINLDDYINTIRRIEKFWFTVAELPEKQGSL
jgi:two-component system, chemotaxis family, response regulator Rcp1